MDQQQSTVNQVKPEVENAMGQEVEEGQVIEIKQKIEKVKIAKKQRFEIDGSDSQWSWDSIEDLKGIDLKKLQAEEDENGGRIEPQHKEKQKIKVVYPQKPTNIQNLTAKYVGSIIQLVGDLLIVQADLKSTYQVVDLDGWICDQSKNFIGFVIDVFGKIQSPFYAIKPQQHLQNLPSLIGRQIYYIEGTKILNEDEIKSIQSKNNKEFDIEQQSSSSDYEKQDREMSMQAPQLLYNRDQNIEKRDNLVNNRRQRRSSFDHGDRNQDRSRTRDNFRNKNWNARNNNQQYLQQMYAMHYNQMMQFYHPNYQANTATIPTIPPPPLAFGNPHQQQFSVPPNFVPGNNPNFIPGNQSQRQNAFIPQQQNPYPQNQHNNQNDNRFARR